MKIKVEPHLMRRGNKVAKAAVEFEKDDSFMAGFHMVGFTICEDEDKKLFVLFPASIIKSKDKTAGEKNRSFFFLRPDNDERLNHLEDAILKVYEDMVGLNHPVIK